MSKTWLVTPAFCKAPLLQQCLEHLYDNESPPNVEHVVIDNHYPIEKEKNQDDIRRISNRRGCTYVDSGRDLGLHEGINAASRLLAFGVDDIVVGCDPDDRPTPGFTSAIQSVMRADPKIGVLALNFWVIEEPRVRDHLEEKFVAGHRVWYHPGIEMWTACGFNWGFVTKAGGLMQPNSHYGGLESAMSPHMHAQRMRLAYLPDFRADAATVDRNDKRLFDLEYRIWKTAHVGGYKKGFEDWLKEFQPDLL